MTPEDDDTFEPHHEASPTEHALSELELYGYRPDGNTPDPRLVPEDNVIEGAVSDIFDALISTMADTALDTELDDLLWSTVNIFHRAALTEQEVRTLRGVVAGLTRHRPR